MLIAPSGSAFWQDQQGQFQSCANRAIIGCNWLVADAASNVCLSCRHTVIIPDLSFPENTERWAKLEAAKRTVFYSLLKFRLPLWQDGQPHARQLRFELKADTLSWSGFENRVVTGHEDGRITINIAEADDDVRERHRVAMGEPYRTLIGHFRHELGHYYWDCLIGDGSDMAGFRSLFGDERSDYAQALQRYYNSGAPAGWNRSFVSAYATSHPWEDFAETWSHYFHIVDGLETAESYGLGLNLKANGQEGGAYAVANFKELIDGWIPLTIAMNAVNRSIGNRDFYPFVLSATISAKLEFIHGLVHNRAAVMPTDR